MAHSKTIQVGDTKPQPVSFFSTFFSHAFRPFFLAAGAYAAIALTAWLVKNGIQTLDLLPYFAGHSASTLTASLLDKHPNERGYDIAGNAVAEFIDKIMEQKMLRQGIPTNSQE